MVGVTSCVLTVMDLTGAPVELGGLLKRIRKHAQVTLDVFRNSFQQPCLFCLTLPICQNTDALFIENSSTNNLLQIDDAGNVVFNEDSIDAEMDQVR